MFSSPSYVVSTMIRASGISSRIAIVAWTPPTPGMRKSMSAISGRCSRNNCTASWPFAASAITIMSGCMSIMLRNPMRTTRWSSAIRIRIGFDLVIGPCVGMASSRWHLEDDPGALAGAADDLEARPHLFGALAHSQETEMRSVDCGRCRRVKSRAIVLDPQHDFLGPIVQFDLNLSCAGVFEGVGNGFLTDPEQVVLDLDGKVPNGADGLQFDVRVLVGAHLSGGFREGGGETVFFQGIRAQVHDRTPRFGQAVTHHLQGQVQMLLCLGRRFGQLGGDRFQLKADAGEGLRQGVVQIPGDAIALCENESELRLRPFHLAAMKGPDDRGQGGQSEREKPGRLIKMRRQ